MRHALITGGGGFIAGHLTQRLLATGYAVDLVDDFSRGVRDDALGRLLDDPSVRLIERDLSPPGALEDLDPGYDLVVHLAAILGVATVLARPNDVLRDNVALLTNVLDLASRAATPPRVVFASTSEVYAGALEHGSLAIPTPESATLVVPDVRHPRTSYMLSKLYGEALCLGSGLPVTIVRPHNFYGPRMGMSHVIPELLGRAHEEPDGGTLKVYSVDHRRTFCFIEDAVETIARAADEPACEGETLNVGAQEPEVSIGELAELVTRVVGKQLEITPLPPTAGSPPRRCPDISKSVSLTGFEPEVALEEGIRRTYDWYRAEVFAGQGVSAL